MYEKVVPDNFETCITLIAFRRPKLLYTTLRALANNIDIGETPLYIYIDGPRDGQEGEADAVAATVKVAEEFEWAGPKKIFPAPQNRGLQAGVRFAIDTSLAEYESTIIVEDDIVTSPFFFRYMLQGLSIFRDAQTVAAICAHTYDFDREKFNPSEPFFLRHFACWGWATWRRSWENVCWDTSVLRDELKRRRAHREINCGIGEHVTGLLEAQHGGYINTWDVQTGVSFFLNGQCCLYPSESLTNNSGWRFDEHSTHTRSHYNTNPPLAFTDIKVDINMPVVISDKAWIAYGRYFYPFRKKLKIIRNKMILAVAPFLRPIKRKIVAFKNA